MKIKTATAESEVLDWLVAKCEYDRRLYTYGSPCFNLSSKRVYATEGLQQIGVNFAPSTNWAQGGPIIEREKIASLPPIVRRIAKERHAFPIEYWRATIQRDENELAIHGAGPTPLIAACRCFVASKLGDEVEVPDELIR